MKNILKSNHNHALNIFKSFNYIYMQNTKKIRKNNLALTISKYKRIKTKIKSLYTNSKINLIL
jgi:hypothetical protein